jgi:hypothetical protein
MFTTTETAHHCFRTELKVHYTQLKVTRPRKCDNKSKDSPKSTSRSRANHYVLANTKLLSSSRMHVQSLTLFRAWKKWNIYITFVPAKTPFMPLQLIVSIRLSDSVVTHNLGIQPTSKEKNCPYTNCLSLFDDIISYLIIVPMIPITPKGHTKNLLLRLIKMLQNNKHIRREAYLRIENGQLCIP